MQKKIDISSQDTAISLTEKLSNIGAKILLKAVDLIEQDCVTFTAQDETDATFAPKLKKGDGLIDWQDSALNIYNRIRGLQPWPGAFTYLENKLLKIWQSKIIESREDVAAAEIVDVGKSGILVQTGKNKLLLTALQLEGKRKMSATEFILGHSIKTGRKLGNR